MTKYDLQNDDPSKCVCGETPKYMLAFDSEKPINVCHEHMAVLTSQGGVMCVRDLDSNWDPTEDIE